MYTHTDAEGKKYLVSTMDDSHLINTIKYICATMNKAKHSMEGNDKRGVMQKTFSQKREYSEEQVTDFIKRQTDNLLPYTFEAAIRNIDISDILQETYERGEAVEDHIGSFNLALGNNDSFGYICSDGTIEAITIS